MDNNDEDTIILKVNSYSKRKIIKKEKEDDEEEEDEKEEDENNIGKLETPKEETKITKKKCSLEEHNEVDAVLYCQECKINMCNKCEKVHFGLLKNHHTLNLNKDINEIFTGICTEPNHSMNLDFYCKTHNKLCCSSCIAKIKCRGNGQHKYCKVFCISKIKNKKKNQLGENIKYLEELLNNLEPTIKELTATFKKIDEKKEKLKLGVRNLFVKIRKELNQREDTLLLEIDTKFNELYFGEDLKKESEKLSNLIKQSLENGKIKENDWDDEKKLNKLVNDCIKIENNIKDINIIYDKIKKFNSNKELEFEIIPKDNKILEKFENIKILTKNEIKSKKIIDKLDSELNIIGIIEEDELRNKILEFNFNEDRTRAWINEKLIN